MASMDERVWQKLLKAFREKPGNFLNAAKAGGVDRNTARKAWCIGYPKMNKKPIQEVVRIEEEEREAIVRARTAAVKTEAEAYAAALGRDVRDETLEEYERTNQYLRAAAITATNMLVATHRLQPVVDELGGMASRLVERVGEEVQQGELSAREALVMLERIVSVMKSVSATANTATLQGAKVVELSRQRQEKMVDVVDAKRVVEEEPFDAVEAARLAEELAAAAVDANGGPILSLLPGGEGVAQKG